MRILITDDHPLFREALRGAITASYPDAEIVESSSVTDSIELLSTDSSFDLALLDLSIPDTEGYYGLMEMRARFSRLPIVIVSGHEDARIIRDVMSHGALGFIPKSSRKDVLISAIKQVIEGEIFLPEDYSEGDVEQPEEIARDELLERLTRLTPQQLKVLKMLRDGLLNKQIAYELGVGETTIKAHVSEILRKLEVYSRTQVVIQLNKLDISDLTEFARNKFG